MRSMLIRKQTAFACTVALGAICGIAGAQEVDKNALVKDSSGHRHPAPFAQYAEKTISAPLAGAAAAPLAVYETVLFDADVLFDAGKPSLHAAGRETLDKFVNKIRSLESRSVMAIGYAERIGTGSNQILSEERVGAVQVYLVGKGIAAHRVKTSGWAATRPSSRAGHVFIEISEARLPK